MSRVKVNRDSTKFIPKAYLIQVKEDHFEHADRVKNVNFDAKNTDTDCFCFLI